VVEIPDFARIAKLPAVPRGTTARGVVVDVGVGVVVAGGVGIGVAVAVGFGVAVAVGFGVAVAVGFDVAVAVGFGVTVVVGVGLVQADTSVMASIKMVDVTSRIIMFLCFICNLLLIKLPATGIQ